MSSKHTPGPWEISKVGNPYDQFMIWAGVDDPIANTIEGEANARLIAAAPEMYEALKQTQAALTYFIDSVEEQVDQKIRGERKKFSFNGDLVQSFEEALSAQEMARAVIAKAKGETQ